ncbi:ATP-binding protein, partial [Streptomyces sp. CAU 1734]|uniref:ATP-binding protein n=1 Tax=Streptomyces sp. CAU 1734 TaxID=3140360 RepID=UPI003260FD8E
MIEIPDLAVVAAGTVSAFYAGNALLRARRQEKRRRAEIASLHARLDSARLEADRTAQAYAAEVAHLARERVPAAAIRAAHPHVQVPGPLDPVLAGGAFGAGLDQALHGVATAMFQERKRVDAAARAGMRGATREIQAGLYRLQDVLRGLQLRYDDPELSQTLYSLDHENEQSLRRAQVTAVVCGAWVGLAREESHLADAVTGGLSRLIGYQRVRISNHLEPGTALVSHAVEPVAIIVAELLDNALRHSSPDTPVTVNLVRVHHGVTVTVDDAGVGMAEDERDYAHRMVAGREPILLSELGDPPRMGLAAIGQLTRQFDLGVDLSSPSPYGGVRAVLLVENHLLSHIDPARRPQAPSAPHSTRGAAVAAPFTPGGPVRAPSGTAGPPSGPDSGFRPEPSPGVPARPVVPGARPPQPPPAPPAPRREETGPYEPHGTEPYGQDPPYDLYGPGAPEVFAPPAPQLDPPLPPHFLLPGYRLPARPPASAPPAPQHGTAGRTSPAASSPARTESDPITHDPAPSPDDEVLPRRRR